MANNPWKGSVVKFKYMDGGTWKVIDKDDSWCILIPLDDKSKRFGFEKMWIRPRDLIQIS